MTRVALGTLFGTAFPEAAGIGPNPNPNPKGFFWYVESEFRDFKMEKALILDDKLLCPSFRY